MSMREVQKKARELLKGSCRVCPICNGKACAGELPGMGGCGTGSGFMANVEALGAWKIHLRTLHGIIQADTKFSLWGEEYTSPIMVAPMTGVGYNLNNATTEEAMAEALVTGAKKAQVVPWTGDGNLPECFEAGIAALKKAKVRGIVTIKPRADDDIISFIRKAEEVNPLAIAVDIDAVGFGAGGKNPLGMEAKTPDAIRAIVNCTNLPVILKGIMTTDEAMLAAELGVKGIVVSNHGGRVVDGTPGTATVLPAIVENVKNKVVIFVDGGFRSGVDVLKALALGADAVLIGRPLIIAAVGGGADGVAGYFTAMQAELVKGMVMTGVAGLNKINPAILYKES